MHQGMAIESSAWNSDSGLLWVSNKGDNGGYTNLSWYGIDTETKEIADSLKWIERGTSDELPRGIDFSPDGQIAYIGTFSNFNERMQKVVKTGTDVRELNSGLPNEFELSQNYPNPFNPTTMIRFALPETGLVTLKVFNVLGEEVAELVNDVKPAGSYEVSFNAQNLTSGMYVYTVQAGNFSESKKMILLK